VNPSLLAMVSVYMGRVINDTVSMLNGKVSKSALKILTVLTEEKLGKTMSKVLRQLLKEDEESQQRRKPVLRLVPPPPPPPHFALHFKPKKKAPQVKPSRAPLYWIAVGVTLSSIFAFLIYRGRVAEVGVSSPVPVPVQAKKSSATPPAPAAKGSPASLVEEDEKLNREAVELYRKQNYTKSLEILMALFSRQPKSVGIAINIAMNLLKQGDLKNAKEFLAKAERGLKPGHELARSQQLAKIYNNQASIAVLEKNFGQAQLLLHRAIDIFPDYSEARLNLARVLEMSGRPEDAINEYEEYLSRGKVDPAVKPTIEKRLAKIKAFVGYLETPEEAVDYSY